jgi:hypothetical protein
MTMTKHTIHLWMLCLFIPLLPACGGDESSAGADVSVDAVERPGADGGSDTTDTTTRPPSPVVPQEFDAAWDLYFGALLDYAVGEACPCFISLGLESSVESCRGRVSEQLTNQTGCYRFALQSNEGAARGFISCELTNYQPAIACQQALNESPGCSDESPCPLNDSLHEDCKLLLAEDQRTSYEGCDEQSNQENDR